MIETLVSILITIVGIFGTAAVFDYTLSAINSSNNIVTGTMLAQQEMENIKRRGFNNFSTYTNLAVTGNTHYSLTTSKVIFTSVSTATVSATVSWKNNTKNVQLQTIIIK